MLLPSLAALLLSVPLAACASLSVSIQPTPQVPNPSTLAASTHAVLLGPPGIQYDTPLRRDNTFVFPDLASASYLLTIHSREYFFPPLRIDVDAPTSPESQQTISAWLTFRGNEWSNKGPSYGTGQGALTVKVLPALPKEYYQERGGFSLIGFLKSPMILMSLVSVVMIFGLPFLMNNMDEETKKEFEEMQKKQPLTGSDGAATQIQNFDLSGWLAKQSSGTSTPPTGGGGSKKR